MIGAHSTVDETTSELAARARSAYFGAACEIERPDGSLAVLVWSNEAHHKPPRPGRLCGDDARDWLESVKHRNPGKRVTLYDAKNGCRAVAGSVPGAR